MKYIKWKSIIITCLVCLLPITFGLVLWNSLPDKIAIHFDFYNNPDNFASKEFVVFAIPLLMVLFQCYCCIVNDINAVKHGECVKLHRATQWIIPSISVVLQILILGYALGWKVDMRAAAALIVGVMLIVIGNYMPQLDYIKNYNIDAEKARKINRFVGIETVIMGLLFIISSLFPPIITLVCIFLFIPYILIGVIYGINVGRKKKNN